MRTPNGGQMQGASLAYQELNPVLMLWVAEKLFLVRHPMKSGLIDSDDFTRPMIA